MKWRRRRREEGQEKREEERLGWRCGRAGGGRERDPHQILQKTDP
jgi:hypothetical protein